MLIVVYFVEEIDHVDYLIDSIRDSSRVMITIYDNIKKIQGKAKA